MVHWLPEVFLTHLSRFDFPASFAFLRHMRRVTCLIGVGQLWKVIEEFLAFVPVPISSPATCVKDSSQLKHLGSSVISEPD
jgi:hypothetical protein